MEDDEDDLMDNDQGIWSGSLLISSGSKGANAAFEGKHDEDAINAPRGESDPDWEEEVEWLTVLAVIAGGGVIARVLDGEDEPFKWPEWPSEEDNEDNDDRDDKDDPEFGKDSECSDLRLFVLKSNGTKENKKEKEKKRQK